MKRIVFLLIAVLVISGSVWAQGVDDYFDMFNVVPTLSTEARYSAGIFSSMVDDYIDVNWYDPKIGTFFFLGGYPSKNTSVDVTDYVTPSPYQISFGLGRTMKNFYLGIYYGGSFVDASGDNDGANKPTKTSDREWANSLALLIGTSAYGAFRLDIDLNTEVEKKTYDGDIVSKERDYAPSFGLTWGGLPALAYLHPYITIGIKLPEKYIYGANAGTNNYKEATLKEGSLFGIQAGVSYDLDDTSSVSGDLIIGGMFGSSAKGNGLAMPVGIPGNGIDKDVDLKTGGVFAFGLKGNYKKTMDFGKVAVGFKPKLSMGFMVDNSDDVKGDLDIDEPATFNFQLRTSIDLGLKYQVSKKFALYTGASLQFFDWTTESYIGGDTKDDSSGWDFNGIAWEQSSLANSGHLGFGLTFTPAENLVIGFGLNTLLDRFFKINLQDMTFKLGDNFNTTDAGKDSGNIGDWALNLFRGVQFDLTVSYKF